MNEIVKKLLHLDCSDKVTQKNKMNYLSWSFAWSEVLKNCEKATYEIKKFENNLPYVFDPKTGYMVFTSVTIDETTHEMWLPVMDFRNKAMIEDATMFDINKTIMRCLTKNLAMFGLGLYIYAGEDLPEESEDEIKRKKLEKEQALKQQKETELKEVRNFIKKDSKIKKVDATNFYKKLKTEESKKLFLKLKEDFKLEFIEDGKE